jgi:DNA polymerase-3 subunit alpha
MVISPISLDDNFGTFEKDGMSCLMLDMEDAHAVGLVKYDFLVLSNIKIIKDTCDSAGIPYPKAHEINWNDKMVWQDMLRSPYGIFQMESNYSYTLLRQYKPTSIEEMSLVSACVRPSGASYRDDLIARIPHQNPSVMIDELLKANNGYLVYQEDQIQFLQQICGLSGSEADTVRRAIGKKNKEVIDKALPVILEGYCNKSDKPREEAEQEAREFLQVLEDAASYSFGYNHSVAYCLIGYLCAYLRYYHPFEFITSYLNNAASQEDIEHGVELAKEYGIVVTAPKFGVSRENYVFDKERRIIARGLSSVKFFNKKIGRELNWVAEHCNCKDFTDVLLALKGTSIDSRHIDILVKIDFFSDFGNIAELTRIVNTFRQLKEGEIKKLEREGLSEAIEAIVAKHGTCVGTKGQELKTYSITDPIGLLHDLEAQIRSLHLKDIGLAVKIANQIDILGYASLATNNPEDRRKLYIEDMTPVITNGRLWSYRLDVMSVGTGKRSRLTLKTGYFTSHPIAKGQLIYCDDLYKNKRGFWEITRYHRIY